MRRWYTLVCWTLLDVCSAAAALGAVEDPIVAAKRKAAADLLRQDKPADAIALVQEVMARDAGAFQDHLLLGRAYDKLNGPSEAAEAYRRVVELIPENVPSPEARAARLEADRRLKILDVNLRKIRTAEDEFLKKLDAFERETIAARDAAAVRRVFKLKGALYRAGERKDASGYEVEAATGWQNTGLPVEVGVRYRIRAVGTIHLAPDLSTTPDGTDAVPEFGHGRNGVLCAKTETARTAEAVGSDGIFVSKTPGTLWLLINKDPAFKNVSGTVTVVVERQAR